MSAIWLLGLGASVGYMYMKRDRINANSIEPAVREYENEAAPSAESNTVNFPDLQNAKRETDHLDDKDFDERYPMHLKQEILQKHRAAQSEPVAYDSMAQAGRIEGLYLEPAVPS
jgi:hypothetical protein